MPTPTPRLKPPAVGLIPVQSHWVRAAVHTHPNETEISSWGSQSWGSGLLGQETNKAVPGPKPRAPDPTGPPPNKQVQDILGRVVCETLENHCPGPAALSQPTDAATASPECSSHTLTQPLRGRGSTVTPCSPQADTQDPGAAGEAPALWSLQREAP